MDEDADDDVNDDVSDKDDELPSEPEIGPASPSEFSEAHGDSEDHVWRDLAAKYLVLFGSAPPPPPHFKSFLKKLRPSHRGFIECSSCRHYTHGEFEPNTPNIKLHFRHYHLEMVDTIKNADDDGFPMLQVALDRLMHSVASRELIDALLSKCWDARVAYDEEQEKAASAVPGLARNQARLTNVIRLIYCLFVTL